MLWATLRFLISVALRLLILEIFSKGYALIWRGYAYQFWPNTFFQKKKTLNRKVGTKMPYITKIILFWGRGYIYLTRYAYFLCQIVQRLRLFWGLCLLGTLEYNNVIFLLKISKFICLSQFCTILVWKNIISHTYELHSQLMFLPTEFWFFFLNAN